MEEKHNKATYNRPEGDRVLDDYFVPIHLPSYIKQIKEEHAWNNSDRNAITVFKTASVTIVLTALHQGAQMAQQSAGDMMVLQVLDGLLTFDTEKKTANLGRDHMAVLHKGYCYDIVAVQESVFLLTIHHEIKPGNFLPAE